jgi:hypothetical protein
MTSGNLLAMSSAEVLSKVEANAQVVDDLERLLLRCTDENQVVSYELIRNTLYINVQDNEYRYLMTKARKRLESRGVLFRTLRGTGLKPLTQGDALNEIGKEARGKVKKTVDQWGGRFRHIDPHKLNQNELETYIKEGLSYHKHEDLIGSSADDKIAAVVGAIENPLSPRNIKIMLLQAKEQLKSIG